MLLENLLRKLGLWITTTSKIWLTVFMLACGSCLFLPCSNIATRMGREMVFAWAIIIFIAFSLKNIWFSLFLVWSATNMILNYNKLALAAVITITLFFVAYDKLVPILRKKPLDFWLNCLCFSVVLQLELCLFQFFQCDPFFSQSKELCGFLDNPTLLSAFLVFCIPAFFRKKWCFVIPIILVVIFYNDNKMAILSLGLMFVFYLVFKVKSRAVKAVIAACLIMLTFSYALFFFHESKGFDFKSGLKKTIIRQSNRRLMFWPEIFELNNASVRRSLLGYGPGNFKYIYNVRYRLPHRNKPNFMLLTQAHNEPLQVWNEFGYIGLVLAMGLLTTLWGKFKRNREALLLPMCGLVGFGVNCLGNFPLHIPPLAFIALFYIGIIESYRPKMNVSLCKNLMD